MKNQSSKSRPENKLADSSSCMALVPVKRLGAEKFPSNSSSHCSENEVTDGEESLISSSDGESEHSGFCRLTNSSSSSSSIGIFQLEH